MMGKLDGCATAIEVFEYLVRFYALDRSSASYLVSNHLSEITPERTVVTVAEEIAELAGLSLGARLLSRRAARQGVGMLAIDNGRRPA